MVSTLPCLRHARSVGLPWTVTLPSWDPSVRLARGEGSPDVSPRPRVASVVSAHAVHWSELIAWPQPDFTGPGSAALPRAQGGEGWQRLPAVPTRCCVTPLHAMESSASCVLGT